MSFAIGAGLGGTKVPLVLTTVEGVPVRGIWRPQSFSDASGLIDAPGQAVEECRRGIPDPRCPGRRDYLPAPHRKASSGPQALDIVRKPQSIRAAVLGPIAAAIVAADAAVQFN